MKIIFEYKDGTYRVVPTNLTKIEAKTQENCLIDEYVVDPDLKNMYIVANDNHIGPFNRHKDLELIHEQISGHIKDIALLENSKIFYLNLIERSKNTTRYQKVLDTLEEISRESLKKLPVERTEYDEILEEVDKRMFKMVKEKSFVDKLFKILRR